jgi:hypothetical protein
MKLTDIRKTAALHAAAALGYITVLVAVLSSFRPEDALPEVLMALTMLSTLVLSAAVMAMLFFFRPVMLLLEGKKKEAALFVLWTMGFFLIYAVSVVTLGKIFIP